MQTEYFIVIDGQQHGPLDLETLRSKHISPDTLVWHTGMPDWAKASDIPELAVVFAEETVAEEVNDNEKPADDQWFAMIDNVRKGPSTIAALINAGLDHNTPVWHAGMADWMQASSVAEIMETLRITRPPQFGYQTQQPPYCQQNSNNSFGQAPRFADNPQYDSPRPNYGDNRYRQNDPYGQSIHNRNPYGNMNQYNNGPVRTNWLPWAIVATIAGALFSCIGIVFGIIGIIQANKANNLYAQDRIAEANAANDNAKINTIIGLIIAGLGFLSSIFLLRFYTGLLPSLLNNII